ncbi:tetratricopeptide repeat protein [Sphingomonas sp.]|uniref:tetratricopeptide repeat protein n=1 Tax=Sphingomonas sp. TaxID=28214 RepID=UPI0025E97B46|nr:tetratricopeptide repeat protein [Sphingomonas sp.]
MKLTSTNLGLLIASASISLASPAAAQYGTPAPSRPPTPSTNPSSDEPQAEQKGPSVSGAARKEIVALQTAVNAKDAAAIPGALAAAQAKAKTKDDRYIIAKLQLKAASDANDANAMMQGVEAVLAADYANTAEQLTLNLGLGQLYYNAKAYDKASPALERVLQLDPNNIDATLTLAETRNGQGRAAEGVALLQKAIATRIAAGQKPEESWYKRALQIAFRAKLPSAPAAALQWVSAYPNQKNWRDTIVIYQNASGQEDAALIDSMRLARAVGALQGENDYYRYTNTLVVKGFPGEAKAVLDEGFASKAIDRSRATFSQIYSLASTRSQGDRASLAASATAAKAAPEARKAMVTAEAYYGYGDYAQAADLLRIALTKNGVDKDLANLRLGMALLGAGDKAGATAAFNAAGGAQAPVAKLWLTYLAQKA